MLAYLACGPVRHDTHGVALGHGVGLEMLTTQIEVGDMSLDAVFQVIRGRFKTVVSIPPTYFDHNRPDRARIPSQKKGKQ